MSGTSALNGCCAKCGGPFAAKRIVIDGQEFHERCAVMSDSNLTQKDYARLSAEVETLLAELDTANAQCRNLGQQLAKAQAALWHAKVLAEALPIPTDSTDAFKRAIQRRKEAIDAALSPADTTAGAGAACVRETIAQEGTGQFAENAKCSTVAPPAGMEAAISDDNLEEQARELIRLIIGHGDLFVMDDELYPHFTDDAVRDIAAFARQYALTPSDGWRPIESAPTQTVDFECDLFVDWGDGVRGRVADCMFLKGEWVHQPVPCLEWEPVVNDPSARVTHWRPLPPPPALNTEGGAK